MSTPRIELDTNSPTPPYEQIRAQVAGLVAAGTLRAGDRMPTVRALAADLGIAAGTAARAYQELETAGVVTTRRRTGTVIAGGVTAPTRLVAEQAATLARAAVASGLDEQAAIDLFRTALRAAHPHPASGPSANEVPET